MRTSVTQANSRPSLRKLSSTWPPTLAAAEPSILIGYRRKLAVPVWRLGHALCLGLRSHPLDDAGNPLADQKLFLKYLPASGARWAASNHLLVSSRQGGRDDLPMKTIPPPHGKTCAQRFSPND